MTGREGGKQEARREDTGDTRAGQDISSGEEDHIAILQYKERGRNTAYRKQ